MTLLSTLVVALLAVMARVQAAAATSIGTMTISGESRLATIPSKGCGREHSIAGETREFGFESNGRHRTYRLHLPLSYDSQKASPLMIAYHGNGNNPAKFENETRFSDDGINPHMIAVYPAGVEASWQGAPYAVAGVDDVAFTMDLIARLKDNYCIDESRVYATGHSNGGGFNDVLACSQEGGSQFAAFAPISGAFYAAFQRDKESCRTARSPLPMLEIHGTGDMTIPYEGRSSGGRGPLPAIPEWVSAWAKRNRCDKPMVRDLNDGIHDYRYQCRGISDALEHIRIEGMGHSWPKAASPLSSFLSLKVVEFLNKHRRP